MHDMTDDDEGFYANAELWPDYAQPAELAWRAHQLLSDPVWQELLLQAIADDDPSALELLQSATDVRNRLKSLWHDLSDFASG